MPRVYTTNYPPDSELVGRAAELGTLNALARSCGVRRESLRDYLARRPELTAAVRAVLHPGHRGRPLPMEEQRRRQRANTRAHSARLQRTNPERKRAINRRWARGQDPERRRYWNHYNRMRRLGAGIDVLDPFALVVARDPCAYCGGPGGEVDHIDAVTAGGGSDWTNLAGACRSCNSSKGNRSLLTFLLARFHSA